MYNLMPGSNLAAVAAPLVRQALRQGHNALLIVAQGNEVEVQPAIDFHAYRDAYPNALFCGYVPEVQVDYSDRSEGGTDALMVINPLVWLKEYNWWAGERLAAERQRKARLAKARAEFRAADQRMAALAQLKRSK